MKLFRPAPELSDTSRLSDVLLLWVREVLSEYDLGESDVFSTVTDGGSDVRRLCVKVMTSSWEWCMPHMLNCALVEVRLSRYYLCSCIYLSTVDYFLLRTDTDMDRWSDHPVSYTHLTLPTIYSV